MENISNPHDKLFREIWSRQTEARSFLEHYLPEDVLRFLDPDSLEICKESFIDRELKDYFSDMLYKVVLQGEPGYVYVLFEHKSYPDRLIQLQLLEYMLKIWRLHLKQQEAGGAKKQTTRGLPIILPLVLYHGKRAWPYGTHFADLLTGPKEALAAYIPNFAIQLTDLTGYSDEAIKGSILSRVVLLLFKHIFDPDPREKFPSIFRLMKELLSLESGLQYIETLLRYVYSATDKLTVDELFTMAQQALDTQGAEVAMTLAEHLRTEGMEKGIQKGIQRGMQKGLEKGMEKGALVGEILFAQKMMKLTIYEKAELEKKSLGDLKSILDTMEAKLQP